MSLKIGHKFNKIISIILVYLKRAKKIKFIIIHYTGMKKESEAIKRLCDLSQKLVHIIL